MFKNKVSFISALSQLGEISIALALKFSSPALTFSVKSGLVTNVTCMLSDFDLRRIIRI